MKIIAFLGNYGKKYKKNRHNAGFIIGDLFAEYYKISVKKKEFDSVCGTGSIDGKDVLLIFPNTFMNNSGKAVNAALKYYNINPDDLIAVHDEIELSFGDLRVKFGGGHKGHNGIRSIIQHTGSPDFHRVRIGVGRPPHPDMDVADFLLSDFAEDELNKLKELSPEIIKMIIGII